MTDKHLLLTAFSHHHKLCHVERSRDISRYHNSTAALQKKVRDSSISLGMTPPGGADQTSRGATVCALCDWEANCFPTDFVPASWSLLIEFDLFNICA
jgi:hypothetical protein